MTKCLGWLGWSEDQFWNSSLKAVLLALDGFHHLRYLQSVDDWKRARMIAFFAVKPYWKDLQRPEELLRIDENKFKKKKAPTIDPEKLKAIMEKMDRHMAKRNGNS